MEINGGGNAKMYFKGKKNNGQVVDSVLYNWAGLKDAWYFTSYYSFSQRY